MMARVDAVAPGFSYLQTCIAAALNQRQSMIGSSSRLGLDGTSHVAMSIACERGKDILCRAYPRCRIISSAFEHLPHQDI